MSTEEENYRNLYPDLAAHGGVLNWVRELMATNPAVTVNGWGSNYAHIQCATRSAQIFIGAEKRRFGFDLWEEGQVLGNGEHTDFEKVVQAIAEWVTTKKSAEDCEQGVGFIKARSNHPKANPKAGAYLASKNTLKNVFRPHFHWASLTVLMITSSCTQLYLQSGPQYDIGFLNKTGRELNFVSVYYHGNEVGSAGLLVKGGRKTFGVVTIPIPDEAEVKWDDAGQSHSVSKKLQSVIPRNFGNGGYLYFIINENGTVDVKSFNEGDTDGVGELIQSVHPKGEYLIGFVNKTGRDFESVAVYYGSQQAGFAKDLLSRVRVEYSEPLTTPLPSSGVELRWVEKGLNQSASINLEGVVAKGFDKGTIFFVINADNTVEVKPIKWKDNAGAAKVVK